MSPPAAFGRVEHRISGGDVSETRFSRSCRRLMFGFRSCRNKKAIYIASVEAAVKPLQIPLTKGGQAFWLTPRVIAHVVPNEERGVQDIYAISVEFHTEPAKIATPDSPVLIGSFPTSTSGNFRYIPDSGILVFSDSVYGDGELRAVKEGDAAWEGRGTTALVYDEGYARHWDTYRGPKHQSLFSVTLAQKDGIWSLGENFINLLAGTKHVGCCCWLGVHNSRNTTTFRDLPSNHLEERTTLTSPRPTLCTPRWTLSCLLRGTPSRT